MPVLFINSLLCMSIFWMELLLRIAIFRSVFLNKLVIQIVSLPTKVNVAQFCVDVVFGLLRVVI